MESLLCAENVCPEGPFAIPDRTLLEDDRVLDNLLSLQYTTMPVQNYLLHIQTDIQSYMRKVVTTWMLEVCEEQQCEDQVFGVAVNLLDRFLCTTIIHRTQFQMVGAVCLLLASKWRQYRSLSVELLSYYTDYSITNDEIKKWELVILSKLGWDLSAVTANDFLEYLLHRIPTSSRHPLVKRHASTFVALAATETEFIQVEPSSLAAGSIITAIRGLRFPSWQDCMYRLASALRTDASNLESVMKLIEDTIERESAELPQTEQQQLTQQAPQGAALAAKQQTTSNTSDFFDGNETPTDVGDIMF